MDEVDKIILQSLKEIDAVADEEVSSLTDFTPEVVVRAVSSCLVEIDESHGSLPRILPAAIAQRFTVATTLAEACTTMGYRNNIGYQTFLYPNVIDIRRLFMFLIEQLPRNQTSLVDTARQSPLKELEILKKDVKNQILQQLKEPWVPQYCRSIANRKPYSCSSLATSFKPQLNINIPMHPNLSKEEVAFFEQSCPNLYQQTSSGSKYDLISTVLHKNAVDLHYSESELGSFKFNLPKVLPRKRPTLTVLSSSSLPEKSSAKNPPVLETKEQTDLSLLDQLSNEINALHLKSEEQSKQKKSLNAQLANLREKKPLLEEELNKLTKELKTNERICLILENPDENITKLQNLVKSIEDKRQTLEEQWKNYRKPLEVEQQRLLNAKTAKNVQSIKDMQEIVSKLEDELREKTAIHINLNKELNNAQLNAIPRKEYTRRIHEFISNIKKQKNDIFKVLNDTRDLQKQINSVSGQLQRQFNYTDDLLFQSAKHDLHAKKAYKLLATLHSNCTELVELVSQTGNITKEIRDLEVQIDNERLKNIANSLEQITSDIKKFEQLYKELLAEKYAIENEITSN